MRTQSTHAMAAKAIRNDLKKAFPETLFSVKSRTYAGGNSVDVEWTNGPLSQEVNRIVGKYQYGHFDGMTDCYNYTNSRNDIPQVKYVQIRREVSEDIKQAVFEECRKRYSGWQHLTSLDHCCPELMSQWNAWTARDFIHRITCKIDLTNPNLQELLKAV